MDSLEGVTVLDFTRILAGPFATMLLGDLGADVTKVERPGGGDETRHWLPPADDTQVATYFSSVNRNKLSVAIDLAATGSRDSLLELVRAADVIVENFRPGVMRRLGLDYESVVQVNPSVIYCSITAFGAGEGAHLPGYDLIVQAVGGLMSLTGESDGDPQKVGVALVDVVTGLFADVGILAALRHRERTGEGQLVEVNLLTCLLAALTNQSTAFTAGGVIPRRMGNAHPSICPYEVYPTNDGDIAIAVGNQRQFTSLCGALGLSELPDHARFTTNADRVANREALRDVLVTALSTASSTEWAERLTQDGVPAGKVNNIAEAFALAEQLGLAPSVDIPRSDGSSLRLPANPIGLRRTPPRVRSAPPALPTEQTPVG